MKVIILAAGEGVRMRPLTETTPKPMLKVLGKPIVEHVFDALPKEITEAVVVTLYLGDQITTFLGSNFKGRKVSYTEGSSRGTMYSFLSARKHIAEGERFLLVNGDELPHPTDVKNCLAHESSILCWDVSDPWNHGVMNVDEHDVIMGIEEKPKAPKGNLIVGGVYVFNGDIFRYVTADDDEKERYFTEVVNTYVKDHRVIAVRSVRKLGGISTPADISRAEKHLKDEKQ